MLLTGLFQTSNKWWEQSNMMYTLCPYPQIMYVGRGRGWNEGRTIKTYNLGESQYGCLLEVVAASEPYPW